MLGSEIAKGTLTWPGCGWNNVPEKYAVELIDVAELQLVEDCPTRKPPKELALGSPALSVHRLDTDANSLRRASASTA